MFQINLATYSGWIAGESSFFEAIRVSMNFSLDIAVPGQREVATPG